MKKYLLGFSVLLTVLIPLAANSGVSALPVNGFSSFIPACSDANVTNNPAITNSTVCSDVKSQGANNNIFITLIRDVIDVISFAVGVAAIYIIVIAAIKMIGSGGDSKAAADARRGIVGALAGIVVVVFAQTFVIFVLDRIK